MRSRRRVPTQRATNKQIKLFDPKAFLRSTGVGRTILRYGPKQPVFSQGERANAVFYIQEGRVRLSVISKQGKEATISLLGPPISWVKDVSPRIIGFACQPLLR